MGMTEKIRIAMVLNNNMSEAELARKMGKTPQNLNNKMKRDNFTVKDLTEIAEALECDLDIRFIKKDTGKII